MPGFPYIEPMSSDAPRTLILPQTKLRVKKTISITELLPLAVSHRDWLASVAGRPTLKAALKDLAICRAAFPAVVLTRRFLLAAAAWFTTLTRIDDLLEEIAKYDAQGVLDVIDTVLNAESDRGTCIFLRTSCGPEQRRGSPSQLDLVKSIIDGVFRRIYSLYPTDDCGIVLHEIYETFQGWKAEISALGDLAQQRLTLHDYMAIKQRTIGISVFAALMYLPSSTRGLPARDSALAYFEDVEFTRDIAKLVAYQNDLFGLARDIQEGESMNACFLIHQRNPGCEILDAARAVLNFHNDTIAAVVAACDRTSTLQQMLLTFVARHAEWASRSSRYQV